MSDLLTV